MQSNKTRHSKTNAGPNSCSNSCTIFNKDKFGKCSYKSKDDLEDANDFEQSMDGHVFYFHNSE